MRISRRLRHVLQQVLALRGARATDDWRRRVAERMQAGAARVKRPGKRRATAVQQRASRRANGLLVRNAKRQLSQDDIVLNEAIRKRSESCSSTSREQSRRATLASPGRTGFRAALALGLKLARRIRRIVR